jgi:hypothetical protein
VGTHAPRVPTPAFRNSFAPFGASIVARTPIAAGTLTDRPEETRIFLGAMRRHGRVLLHLQSNIGAAMEIQHSRLFILALDGTLAAL